MNFSYTKTIYILIQQIFHILIHQSQQTKTSFSSRISHIPEHNTTSNSRSTRTPYPQPNTT